MIPLIVLLLVLTQVKLEIQSEQHHMYVSRKSRSNEVPAESGYIYSQVNDNPPILTEINNGDPMTHHYSAVHSEANIPSDILSMKFSDPVIHLNKGIPLEHKVISSVPVTETIHDYVTPKYDLDYEVSKAKAEHAMYHPASMSALYEKLKSVMHYDPSMNLMNELENGYGSSFEHHYLDDDDIRTISTNDYEKPYLYHSPYEYDLPIYSEINKDTDTRIERNTGKDINRVIPVHESSDSFNSYHSRYPYGYTYHIYHTTTSTENPLAADNPFMSYVLDDYYDKVDDGDDFEFNTPWSKTGDYSGYGGYNTAFDKRQAHKPIVHHITPIANEHNYLGHANHHQLSDKGGKSVREKGYDNNHKFNKYEKKNEKKDNHQNEYKNSGNKQQAVKQFTDAFANKYGAEDHNKDSKYILKKLSDNGEKRKGFRRVYHKDEYSEDNEFYDNKSNLAQAEEAGGSKAHLGGSEAFLQSHAAANIGDEASSFSNAGDSEQSNYENGHKGFANDAGSHRGYNHYSDSSKKFLYKKR